MILPNLAQPYNLRSAVFALLSEHTLTGCALVVL